MRPRIYIASPLSNGGTLDEDQREQNVYVAMNAFVALHRAGFAPFQPSLTDAIDKRHPGAIEWDQWMEIDLPWVEVSHAVLRMAGASKGADQECAHAESKGIPVFRNIADLTAYFALTMKNGQSVSGIHGSETSDDPQKPIQFAPPLAGENPKDGIGSKKPPLHLIPSGAEVPESKVLALGAAKYGAFNWRTARVRASVYLAAARRHMLAWYDGEHNDPESGLSHLAHARASIGILMDAMACGTWEDDRPTKGAAAWLIKEHTAKDGGQ